MNNFFAIGFEQCPICYKEHGETVLVSKRMRDIPQRVCTGHSLCPEHEAMRAEYIAAVEVSNASPTGSVLKPANVKPTGNIAHIRRTAAAQIFNVPLPADLPFFYVEPGVIDKLKEMTHEEIQPPQDPC